MHVRNDCFHLTQELLFSVLKGESKSHLESFDSALLQVLYSKKKCFLPSTGEFESFDIRLLRLGTFMNEIFGFHLCKTYKLSTRQNIIDMLLVAKLCKFHWIDLRVQFLLTIIETLPICHTPA
jgi:hypothetical protein